MTLLNESVSVSAADGGVVGLGNINPILYALATSSPSAFHDIVSGNNDVPCSAGVPGCPSGGGVYGYDAGPGYDFATGIGTIDAKNLVAAWSSVPTSTSLAVSATNVDVGAPITLTATVTSSGTTGSMSGDTVSFTFETYAAAGNSDGGFDESWVLSTSTVTATSTGGRQGATAAYTTAIPAGFNGKADVVAMFNGDPHYLASRLAKTRITLANLTFAAVPPSAICEPSGTVQFSTTGGTPPVRWYVLSDSTYSIAPGTGYTTAATVTNAGLYTAGPNSGSSVLVVMDSAGNDAFVTVTVDDFADAGVDAGEDSGTDSGTADAGTDSGALADAGSDASADSGSEDAGSVDAESDATVDSGYEAGGADAASDASVYSGSEAGITDAEQTSLAWSKRVETAAPRTADRARTAGRLRTVRRRRATPAPRSKRGACRPRARWKGEGAVASSQAASRRARAERPSREYSSGSWQWVGGAGAGSATHEPRGQRRAFLHSLTRFRSAIVTVIGPTRGTKTARLLGDVVLEVFQRREAQTNGPLADLVRTHERKRPGSARR